MFNYSPKIITDGLILYLDAANPKSYTSGSTIWGDLTRNGNSGTLTNGPTFNSANGESIVFDGTNDYINIPHNPIFDLTTSMSFNFWFKSTKTVNSYISSKGENSFYIGVGPSGQTANKMSFYLNGTSGGWLQSVSDVSTGNWLHTALTWNGTTSSIYINGILDNSASRSGTVPTGGSNVTIGVRLNTSNNIVGAFLGNVSSFSIYNKALSATEIQQNFNATKGRFGL